MIKKLSSLGKKDRVLVKWKGKYILNENQIIKPYRCKTRLLSGYELWLRYGRITAGTY